MVVLYRCEEDNTLCMHECEGIYRDSNAVYITLQHEGAERVCFDMPEDKYEERLCAAVHDGVVDFSDFMFKV